MFLKLKNIDFKYKNNKELIIKNFSHKLKKGKILAILGESGSGKSTLLRIIAGLEVPKKGEIILNDKVLVNKNEFVLPEKRGIGMLFQDYALFPHMNVAKNIEFGLKNFSKKEKAKKVNEVLELVNLIDYKNRYPHELSGGQQQRIALARSIAIEPSLILMDEPFSSLDANLQSKIRKHLKEILTKTKITSIFVTHDKDDAVKIADEVIVMKDGEILQHGIPLEVMKDPKNSYVKNLFHLKG
ncbi:MAG: ABC transporter ATP-binding protein [Fusobacteriota bacterium]